MIASSFNTPPEVVASVIEFVGNKLQRSKIDCTAASGTVVRRRRRK